MNAACLLLSDTSYIGTRYHFSDNYCEHQKSIKNVVKDKTQNPIVDLSRNWINGNTYLSVYPSNLTDSIPFCLL